MAGGYVEVRRLKLSEYHCAGRCCPTLFHLAIKMNESLSSLVRCLQQSYEALTPHAGFTLKTIHIAPQSCLGPRDVLAVVLFYFHQKLF